MLQEVLHTTKEVVQSAKLVKIDHQTLSKVCEDLNSKDFQSLNVNLLRRNLTPEQKVSLLSILSSVNFSFWPNKNTPDWQFKIGKRTYGHIFGLQKAFEKAAQEGLPITDAHFLANLRKEKLAEILKGNVEIPMLNERVSCLQETGQVLLDEFEGNFMNVLEEANKSAAHFVNLLFYFFPSFNDQSILYGKPIHFHKRAQLNAKMIYDALRGRGLAQFEDLHKLTLFADYLLPQVLRRMGILIYEKSLAEKIDANKEITAGSREEIEMRSASIWAGEYMKEALCSKIPTIKSIDLDSFIRLTAKETLTEKPFHRTRTIAY